MLSNHPNCLGGNGPSASSDLIGDVDGPASATDNAVARFDGTTGKLIQNSTVTIADSTGAIAGAQSLTSPAATDLTLAGGSSGASLVLGQGANGIGTFNRKVSITGAAATESLLVTGTANEWSQRIQGSTTSGQSYGILVRAGTTSADKTLQVFEATGTTSRMLMYGDTGNLLIGGTTDISGSGGLKVFGTTAGSAGAGALVVTGGLSAGAASYIGGDLTVSASSPILYLTRLNTANNTQLHFRTGATSDWQQYISGATPALRFYANGADRFTLEQTGAATFAGAVTVNGATASSALDARISSATTADTVAVSSLSSISSGTAADGFGGRLNLLAENLNGSEDTMASIRWAVKNTGYSNREGELSLWTFSNGTAYRQLTLSPGSGAAGASTFVGSVTAASLATAQTAAAATSIVITHKIPITLNGTVYYMALTATP